VLVKHSVRFHVVSKHLKTRIYKYIILRIVLFGCETLHLIMRNNTKCWGHLDLREKWST